jgi:hypothetical protein
MWDAIVWFSTISAWVEFTNNGKGVITTASNVQYFDAKEAY